MSTPQLTSVKALSGQPSASVNADLVEVRAFAAQPATPNATVTAVQAIAEQPSATPAIAKINAIQAIFGYVNRGVSRTSEFGLPSRVAPAMLVDVLTLNGSSYAWSSHDGLFPIVITPSVKITRVYIEGLGGPPGRETDNVFVTVAFDGISSPFEIGQTIIFAGMQNATFLNGVQMIIVNQGFTTISKTSAVTAGLVGFITTSDPSLNTVNTFHYYDESATATLIPTASSQRRYLPYVVSAGPFQFSRSLSRNGGQIVIQNISGNTIERDVLKAMRGDEFEGAFAVFRLYDFILGESTLEFHGILSQQSADETKVTFNLGQLVDPTLQNIPQRISSNLCTWIYKSDACGSTGTADTCPKTPEACKDPRRNAFPRFNGFGSPPLTQISGIQYQQPLPSLNTPSRKAAI